MSDDHEALIVEDDADIAEVLVELVRSLGHRARHVVTLQGVRREVAAGGYCYVLLDMQIPSDDVARPLVGSGETALALVRKRSPERHTTDGHVVPVLVVTSYSREPEFVDRMFEAGADGFLAKPFGDLQVVAERIRRALAKAGRSDHDACGRAEPPGPAEPDVAAEPAPAAVRLVIDGARVGKRSRVTVNGERVDLQERLFSILLRLVAARGTAEPWLTHQDLGTKRTPEAPSRLRKALGVGAPAGAEIIENWNGRYRLGDAVTVEHVAWDKLREHGSDVVRRLARAARK